MKARFILTNLYRRYIDHDVPGLAAQVGYYFTLSLFPFLIGIIALISLMIKSPRQIFIDLAQLGFAVPKDVEKIINEFLGSVFIQSDWVVLILSVVMAIWISSKGTAVLTKAMNRAYHSSPTKNFFLHLTLQFVNTLLLMIAILVALILPTLSTFLLELIHFKDWGFIAWLVPFIRLQNIIYITVIFIILATLFKRLPNVDLSYRSVIPGTLFSITFWWLTSQGFNYFLMHFATYPAIYGSFATPIVLMIWFYLIGLSLMLGIELNASLINDKESRK